MSRCRDGAERRLLGGSKRVRLLRGMTHATSPNAASNQAAQPRCRNSPRRPCGNNSCSEGYHICSKYEVLILVVNIKTRVGESLLPVQTRTVHVRGAAPPRAALDSRPQRLARNTACIVLRQYSEPGLRSVRVRVPLDRSSYRTSRVTWRYRIFGFAVSLRRVL
jgi:hypothetical protein